MILIVCATGPSINNLDWTKLSQYKKIGINQFFRKGVPTEYYYVYDKMCIIREKPNFTSVIDKWPNTIFYIDKRIELPQQYIKNTNIVLTTSRSIKKEQVPNMTLFWAKNLEEPLYINKSTITGAINIAHILGATEIYLAGLDGHGGYFYPHKKNIFDTRLHDSLVYYPQFGSLFTSMQTIVNHLLNNGIKVYNTNPKSFFVQKKVMEYRLP